MKQRKEISRRRFLGVASCAAVGATPMLSSLVNLSMTNAASLEGSPPPGDYKALVCLLLAGGNDSFNMLVPSGATEYAEYASARSNLALAQNTLVPLNGSHEGKSFGLHPGMPELAAVYNAGEAAFVANVGTLVEPTTLANYEALTANLPLGLFSHADQIEHWQTSVPDSRTGLGWGGRAADILQSLNSNPRISMNISIAGTNTFQSGDNSVSYEILPTGNGSVQPALFIGDQGPLDVLAASARDSLIDEQYSNLLQQSYASTLSNSIDASEEFSAALEGAPALQTAFSETPLSASFQMIARVIAARQTLGMQRQTFFVQLGGWDHHSELLNNHAAMLPTVSRALSEFNAAMKELSVHDQVTTFTASDFARTLSSNGQGSDHAWGGNQIVMGGAVAGGSIYGSYPSLALGSSLDTGRGRLIPTMSTDLFFAELARWFGVPDGCLLDVLPNLDRFYSIGSGSPVGFMNG